jgi:hypothetical protein
MTVYDFGTTGGVPLVAGTFLFRNTGDGILKVDKPKPACGCTVASVKPDTLKPGEKGELVFTLTLPNIHGHISKTITVPSNDPTNANVVLTVQLDNKPRYELTAAGVALGDVREGTMASGSVDLKRMDGGKLSIDRAAGGGSLTVLVERIDDVTARLNIKLPVSGPPRRFAESVWVYATDETDAIAAVTVYGRVVGDLGVNPEALSWGITDPSNWPPSIDATTRRVSITSTRKDPPLEISDLTCDVKELKVELVSVEKGKSYAIVASLPQPPKGTVQGSISFNTNDPAQSHVVVPVIITVSGHD